MVRAHCASTRWCAQDWTTTGGTRGEVVWEGEMGGKWEGNGKGEGEGAQFGWLVESVRRSALGPVVAGPWKSVKYTLCRVWTADCVGQLGGRTVQAGAALGIGECEDSAAQSVR